MSNLYIVETDGRGESDAEGNISSAMFATDGLPPAGAPGDKNTPSSIIAFWNR